MNRLRLLLGLAVLGGLAIHVVLLLAPWKERDLPAEDPDSLGVLYFPRNGAADPSLREQATLFDSAPLFMPTRWNSASRYGNVTSLREATDLFIPYPARVRLPADPPALFPRSVPDPSGLSPASGEDPEGIPDWLLARYGREPARPLPAVEPSGPVRIDRLSGPSTLPRQYVPLPADLAMSSPRELWQPAVFHLHLHHGSVVGRAVRRESSGFPEWDGALARYFSSPSFAGKLPDGYYRILVFP